MALNVVHEIGEYSTYYKSNVNMPSRELYTNSNNELIAG